MGNRAFTHAEVSSAQLSTPCCSWGPFIGPCDVAMHPLTGDETRRLLHGAVRRFCAQWGFERGTHFRGGATFIQITSRVNSLGGLLWWLSFVGGG
jgi:hypothetical protein